MKFFALVPVLSIFTIAGCATKGVSTANLSEASKPTFTPEKFVAQPQSLVWDKLVKNMATSFFVINNIDKESRIINLSFSADKPQDYVDCGKSHRTYFDGKTTESFEYGVADNFAAYKVASNYQPTPAITQTFLVSRRAKLEGRANVYVAPEDKGTRITVNTKSIVRIKIDGVAVDVNSFGVEVRRQMIPSQNVELTAVTKGPTQNSVPNGQKVETITCYSTGALEKAILDLAN